MLGGAVREIRVSVRYEGGISKIRGRKVGEVKKGEVVEVRRGELGEVRDKNKSGGRGGYQKLE